MNDMYISSTATLSFSFNPVVMLHFLFRTNFAHSLLLYLCTCLFLLFPYSAHSDITTARPGSQLAQELSRQLVCYPLDQLILETHRPTIKEREICLAAIYNTRDGEPFWVTPDGPGPKAHIIIEQLRRSEEHGLIPENYQVSRMESLWSSKRVHDLVELEGLLSYNLVKYIHDISYGQLKPFEENPQLFAEAGEARFDPLLAIQAASQASDLNRFLNQLPPSHHHYRHLKDALKTYRRLKDSGGWPQVPDGPSLHAGDVSPAVPALRKRLSVTGDYIEEVQPLQSLFFNIRLERAVIRFQKRHGLEPDGIVGPNTRAALNIPVEERVENIRLNLARWRWQAHNLGEKYLLVNIASFSLKAFRNNGNELALDIPVIVGKQQHQTPVFSDSIKYLDFNPFWNITPSIARNEELIELRKNPYHLIERNVRLFSSWSTDAVELDSTSIDWHKVSRSQISGYKLRQDPGPWNALGKVKFVFPNRYSVYMHDTPAPDLFNHHQRSFSHGCIRVGDPLALAIFSLDGQNGGWNEDKVINLYKQSSRKVIRLSSPLPVHITYQTTWVDKDGTINFNRDIYARDEKLHKALLK